MTKWWGSYTRSKFVAIILVLVLMIVSVNGLTVFGESDETQIVEVGTAANFSTTMDQSKLLDSIVTAKTLENFSDSNELAGFDNQTQKDAFIDYVKEKTEYTLFYISGFDQTFESKGSLNVFVGCSFGTDGQTVKEEVIFAMHNLTTETKDYSVQISGLDEMIFSVEANNTVYSIDSKNGILQTELETARTKSAPTTEPEVASEPTATPNEVESTKQPTPTLTPAPEITFGISCYPTAPPRPTATPKPTATPTPKPTATPVPTATPTPIPQITPTPIPLEPEISKTAVRDSEDLSKYTVNLSVSGDQEVQAPKPVDVVVALDVSNSMYWSMQDSTLESTGQDPIRYYDHRSRWYALQVALKGMVDGILDVPGSRVSIVIYSGNFNYEGYIVLKPYGDSSSGWYSDKDTVNKLYYSKDSSSTVPTVKLVDLSNNLSGTNGQAGFSGAKSQLSKITSSTNSKHVVYMSDGVPNRYRNSAGTLITTYNIQEAGAPAIAEAKAIVSSYGASIYTVGLGAGLTTHPEVQQYLMNPIGANKYNASYTQADTNSDLTKLFGNLTEILTRKVNNVEVEDQISEFVNPVLANGCPQFKLIKNGAVVLLTPFKVSTNIINYIDASNNEVVTYTADTKTIKWKVGDSLGSEDTYTLSYPVVVNEKAIYYQNGYQGKTNCNLADVNTGTHSGQYGYRSNDHAKIIYNGGQEKAFPHPVVQPLPDATLRITKKLSLDGNTPAGMKFNFLVKINGANYSGDVYIGNSTEPIKIVNGQLCLKAGEVASINRLKEIDTYSVEEIGIVANEYYESTLVKTEQIATPKDTSIAAIKKTLPTQDKVVQPVIVGEMSAGSQKSIADIDLIFTNKLSYIRGSITVTKSLIDKSGDLQEDDLDTNSFIFELSYVSGFSELVGTTCFGSITINKGDTGTEMITDSNGNKVPKYSFKFDNLPVGNYKIKEVNHMRYDMVSIDMAGLVTITSANRNQKVNVKNTKGRDDFFSDSAIAVNIGNLISNRITFIKKED